jgi:hypothetical protein
MSRKYEPAPITSKHKFKEIDDKRKEINRLNRQRAKAMEKRVARYLDGTQTPQSGAGSAKGDILIDFVSRPGKYMIECKLSAARPGGKPRINIYKYWIPKMKDDAKAMRALFPLLVYHFHDIAGDFVVINIADLHKLQVFPENLDEAVASRQYFDTPAKTVVLTPEIANLTKKPPYYTLLSIDGVIYYHMTLEYFRDLLKGI